MDVGVEHCGEIAGEAVADAAVAGAEGEVAVAGVVGIREGKWWGLCAGTMGESPCWEDIWCWFLGLR